MLMFSFISSKRELRSLSSNFSSASPVAGELVGSLVDRSRPVRRVNCPLDARGCELADGVVVPAVASGGRSEGASSNIMKYRASWYVRIRVGCRELWSSIRAARIVSWSSLVSSCSRQLMYDSCCVRQVGMVAIARVIMVARNRRAESAFILR